MRLDLSDDGRAALEAIVTGQEAWSMLGQLLAVGHTEATLAGLEAAELVERWERPDGQAVTLSPWGKFLCDREILERVTLLREDKTEDDAIGRRVVVKVEVEDVRLFWGREGQEPTGPVRLPRRRHEFRMPYPDLRAAPGPGPEYLLDDDGEPVRLFARLYDGTPTEGVPVEVDRRIKGKGVPKAKPAEVARTVNLYDKPSRGLDPKDLDLAAKPKRAGKGKGRKRKGKRRKAG